MERDVLAAALGVGPDPSTGEIRAARRTVARRLHPDRTGTDRTRVLMAEVNAACDRWIAEIRASPRRPTTVDAQPKPHAASVADRARTSAGSSGPLLRVRDVLATLGLLVTIAVLTTFIVGATATSLAVGLLLGSGAAATYMAALRRIRSLG